MSQVRKLRERLGMSQQQFATAIGRSFSSLRAYEAGAPIAPEVLAKVRELSPADYDAIFTEKPVRRSPKHDEWHRMLDNILESGVEHAVEAIQSNLISFNRFVSGEPQRVAGVTLRRPIKVSEVVNARRRAKAP